MFICLLVREQESIWGLRRGYTTSLQPSRSIGWSESSSGLALASSICQETKKCDSGVASYWELLRRSSMLNDESACCFGHISISGSGNLDFGDCLGIHISPTVVPTTDYCQFRNRKAVRRQDVSILWRRDNIVQHAHQLTHLADYVPRS